MFKSSGFVVSEYLSSVFSPCVTHAVRSVFAGAVHRVRAASRTATLTLAALIGTASLVFAEDRSLKLYFTHTGERATITYKRDGRFDQKGLAQMNRFLRDWRRNETARMDPRLLDLMWEIYERTGSSSYIHVVSAYRSPSTNNMLRGRSRSTGVARKSQHMLGKAMDFFIPGVKLSTIRGIAMQLQGGGVGYYPTFVHVDVGSVRAWPRMSRQELARLFPNGRTMHLPSNGRPLAGYELAVADYKRRGGGMRIEAASSAPDEDDDDARPSRASRPSGSSLVTAMLPTPKSRAQDALAEQTSPRAAAKAATAAATTRNEPDFVDLAKLAAPVPSLRPAATQAIDPVQTAALAPSTVLAPRPVPAPVPAFGAMAALAPPAGIRELRTPSGSIASLPIGGPDADPEDEFDGDDVLMAWAISAPGSPVGMAAPVVVGRLLTDLTATSSRTEPLPLAVAEEFDHDRFWPGG